MKKKNNYIHTKLFVVFILLFGASDLLKGQDKEWESKLQAADELYNNFAYTESIEAYEALLDSTDNQYILMLKIANAHQKTHDLESAEEWYKKALLGIDLWQPEDLYHYAEVLAGNNKYNEATDWYKQYQQLAPEDQRASKKLEALNNIDNLYDSKETYQIDKVSISSLYSDFSPTFYDSGIVFASAREEVSKAKQDKRTNSAYLNLYYSPFEGEEGELGKPIAFDKKINTKYHEGPAVFFDNDNKLIFTRNNFLNGKANESDDNTLNFQMFYTDRSEKGTEWTKPKPFSFNSEEYSVGHPAVSRDGLHLYFASNMPDGYGGSDLYYSEFKNGEWSAPQNLGNNINTEGNEMFPFLHDNGNLYFASDGHGGLGGLDIFHIDLASVNQSNPTNMGFPLNTNRDDFSLILDSLGTNGYFASNRDGQTDNLYQVRVLPPKPAPVEQIAEKKPDSDTGGQPIETKIIDGKTMIKEVYYTVQILALINPITVRRSFVQNLKGVLKHDGKDGFHRYTYGEYESFEGAETTLKEMIAMGYDDAFIRRVERYVELSKSPGVALEELYERD